MDDTVSQATLTQAETVQLQDKASTLAQMMESASSSLGGDVEVLLTEILLLAEQVKGDNEKVNERRGKVENDNGMLTFLTICSILISIYV
jgi:hypothetical protein